MISNETLQQLKHQLEETKKEVQAHLDQNDHYQMEQEHPYENVGELSAYDNHPGDLGTELYEREKDLALNEHAEKEMKDIEHALMAMKHGTYGSCEICGEDISEERLIALPTTTFCKEHSQDKIVSHNRPVEEKVLMPPYGRFEYDETEGVTFDAEDTWQIVQRYGTSETPSDFSGDVEHYDRNYVESEENEGYVEDYENFIGTDMYGQNITVYPSIKHEAYEDALDEEGIMTSFGDLHGYEKDPYTE
ncbi:TraR/DksA C4-type zinc finger protein [Sutcliffiella rhizosphaerae]|uniref:RNA polymerase-binding transcription factor DksA n=1 Tax=Sutcliffiella rhizosphaerae TaxID=2880967 RepID=A0ABN8AB23_9BACI|nr:TraR/DksA C4-type zinc finger protein [Sutcliffiella rhizosphaerae]CAG9622396.1 RNA polymerase-binding transcription factor DksA [Sutcliffiella rhizosphaerae]